MPKKVPWEPGAVFLVPLPDGTFGVGQVAGMMMLNCVHCAFTNYRLLPGAAPATPLEPSAVIAALTVTREQLDFGAWPIRPIQPLVWPINRFANERFRSSKWVGAKIYDAAIAEELLAAYFGLRIWDDGYDPSYLDKLLLRPDLRPASVRLKASRGLDA